MVSDTLIKNIIKIRNDLIPLILTQENWNSDYCLADSQQSSSWIPTSNGSNIKKVDLRSGIEPWLTSLFKSEHLSLLVGTGLSKAIESIAAETVENTMSLPKLSTRLSSNIKESAKEIAYMNNRGEANIEDYIKTMNDLICGLEILGYHISEMEAERATYDELKKDILKTIGDFADKICRIENNIALAKDDKRQDLFEYLVSFLMSFASRTGTRERLNIFTTNYDRLIEAGSELAGLHLLDRFIGTLAPIFRSSRLDIDMHYNPPGIRGEPRYLEGVARFTKLHVSIDWINTGADIRRIGLPFGSMDFRNFLNAPGIENTDVRKLMIYPNSAKDRETAEYPYVELFRDFASSLCRPNCTLVTYGYGFGDEHINRVIRDMLTIPSTHLVIISYDEMEGRILAKFNEFARPSQISLIIGKGVAELKTLVDFLLPKPSIDRASMRMNDLLKQRYNIPKIEAALIPNGGEDEL